MWIGKRSHWARGRRPRRGVITIRKPKGDARAAGPLHRTATEASRATRRCETGCARGRGRARLSLQRRHAGAAAEPRKASAKIITVIGSRTAAVRPRVDDLRHRFAVQTLIDWQRSARTLRVDDDAVHLSRPRQPRGHIRVLAASPELMVLAATGSADGFEGARWSALAPSMQAYLTDRLIAQRGASPTTIAAYRRDLPAAAGFASRRPANRQRAGHRPARRAADRCVPEPSREHRGNSARTRTTASR